MLAHSFLIESSSKLLVTRTGIKAGTSLISALWFPWPIYMFFEMRFDLGTLDSYERLLPFGLLVSHPPTVLGGHPVVCVCVGGGYSHIRTVRICALFSALAAPKDSTFSTLAAWKDPPFQKFLPFFIIYSSKTPFCPCWAVLKAPPPPFSVEGHSLSPPFCRTCFSMDDLGVQVSVCLFVRPSVCLSVRPSVNIYQGCLVSTTPLTVFTDLFETLQIFSSWCVDVHVVWI